MHPDIGLKLVDSYVKAEAAIGGRPEKNRVAVTPGRFVPYAAEDRRKARVDISKLEVVQRRGGKVACVKYSNGQWGLEVDGKPFVVRGLTYTPTRVGQNYAWNWMAEDENFNKKNDVAYDSWVDANRNNKQDPGEPVIGDFQLLKEMGCNTIRVFNSLDIDKELLRDLYKTYGIRAIVCDFFGAYTVHSMASWNVGTDYSHPDQRRLMKEFVLKTVAECKDEPWLLGYILGNENNMPLDYTGVNASRTQAAGQPKVYAEFLNEVAAAIHALDPDHPVGVGNVGLGLVDAYAKYAPELDFIGVNDYPGSNGFGALWIRARKLIDRPILITEYGCDAYWTGKGVDEEMQANYLKNEWEDIEYNLAGAPGEGNAIGGIIFEWLDEWWKDTRGDPADRQNTEPTAELAFPDGWSQEEFFGIVGQGDGFKSPFLRQPRKAYYLYKELWNKK
jgi:beta-glucuronidase